MRFDPFRRRRERDLDEEIQSHLRMATEDRAETGRSPEEAAREVRREFGNVSLVKDVTRDMWGGGLFDQLTQDIQFALRLFRRNPWFALTAVLTIALGIAANTTVFTVVDQVLFRPPPYLHGDRLVQIGGLNKPGGSGGNILNAHRILGWQAQQVFDRLEGFAPQQFDLVAEGEPERVRGYTVTTGLFSMLGSEPAIGRVFGTNDGRRGDERVAILGHQMWHRRFAASADVIGRTILLNDEPYRVIGVMPPRFLDNADILLPFDLRTHDGDETFTNFLALGRLPMGVEARTAQVQADSIANGLNDSDPQPRSWYISVRPWRIVFLSEMAHDALLVLLVAVGFVLLIACANVANLLLSRAVVRQREMAVRAALGASRGRLIRQALTESTIVAMTGGVLGVALATVGVDLMTAALPSVPFIDLSSVDLRIDGRILAFAALATGLTAFACGIVPALRESLTNPDIALRGATSRTGYSTGRISGSLVMMEVAFSIVLLVGAALLIRTFARLGAIDAGFTVDGVVTATIGLSNERYPTPAARSEFFNALDGAIRRHFGVSSVAISSGVPPDEMGLAFGSFETDDDPARSIEPHPYAGTLTVSGSFFETLQIPIVDGRTFVAQEADDSVIVNHTLASLLWPEGNVVGRRIRQGSNAPWQTVIGVVNDIEMRMNVSNNRLVLQMYRPLVTTVGTPQPPAPAGRRTFVTRRVLVRAKDSADATAALKDAVRSLDTTLPVQQIEVLRDRWDRTFAPQRLVMLVMGFFSVIAVLLASAGLFAVVSHAVAQRTHEIGVRVALGATRSDILQLVMTRGMALVVCGVLLGVAGAVGVTRALTSLLYQVSPYDPLSFFSVSLGLLVAAAIACWLPARRAMTVDPAVVLRMD